MAAAVPHGEGRVMAVALHGGGGAVVRTRARKQSRPADGLYKQSRSPHLEDPSADFDATLNQLVFVLTLPRFFPSHAVTQSRSLSAS
jgi:hypothetical protein